MSMPALNHNNPPGPIEFAHEAITSLSKFLSDHPVIENEDQARAAKLFVDRTRATIHELDDARKKEVTPLNDQVDRINTRFRAISAPLKRVFEELKGRLTDFACKEEAKRIKEAEQARIKAEMAEMEARLAEQAEREARSDAANGALDVDLASAAVEADARFDEFKAADRAAKRAERDSHVRVGGGFSGRSLSLRTKETLILDDALSAVMCIGLTEGIREAILTAARAFRKEHGELPAGVRTETERSI